MIESLDIRHHCQHVIFDSMNMNINMFQVDINIDESYPNYQNGESGREEKEISEETPSEPEEGEVPVDELKLLLPIGPRHQVPALQFLCYKSIIT